jgi:hypothetical protein
MRFVTHTLLLAGLCTLSTLTASHAAAQDEGDETADTEGTAETPDEAGDPSDPEETVESGSDAAATGDAQADARSITGYDPETSPREKKGETYHFLGLRYRGIVAPQFMMSLFGADGGTTVYVHGIGPEFGIRKDNFEYILSVWYAGYFMDPTPFKGKSDPVQSWELVESDVKVIYLTADFMWSAPISEIVAFNYGLGAGIGFPFGDLRRTEIYDNGESDKRDWGICTAAGVGTAGYCEEGPKNEPTWADGGSKPIIFPWLVGQLGLRIKPHRRFALRLDLVGFGTSGFFFGVGADYGL